MNKEFKIDIANLARIMQKLGYDEGINELFDALLKDLKLSFTGGLRNGSNA